MKFFDLIDKYIEDHPGEQLPMFLLNAYDYNEAISILENRNGSKIELVDSEGTIDDGMEFRYI